MDSYHHLLPKLGQTRCYWALLSTDLQFIYLDPVFAYHLESEADLLPGKSLLSFVHPDEQASAKTDLRSVLESRTLHGSVTRVRFSRLSKIRRQLGHTGPSQTWSEEDKLAVDANYMAVDIVINWAAEGLVLCFIHATVDLDPQSDNDELNKSHWTNWCGTPYMPVEQFHLLYRRLLEYLPQRSLNNAPTRIFQILANQPRRQLLLSWPPDQGNSFTGRDFAKLVENAELAAGPQKGNDAKTSCTRRYRATQLMSPSLGEVESIFIPHGSVIFACHKVESSMRSTSTNSAPMEHQLAYNINNAPNYPTSSAPPYYDSPTSYPLSPAYNQGYLTHQSISLARSPPPTYPSSRWAQPQQPQTYSPTQPLPAQQQWTTPSPTHPIAQLPPLLPHTHTPPSLNNNSHRSGPYSNTLATGPSWQAPSGGYEVYRGPSPAGYGVYSSPNVPRSTGAGNVGAGLLPATTSLTSPNVAHDVVPPPKRRISPGSAKGGDQYSPATSSGRGTGNRPSGILECSSCGATASPEWRKGPSGKKELCNACGLRYARSRAKKDGTGSGQGRSKKADKVDVHEKAGHHHVVGGNGGTNGADLKRNIRAKHGSSAGGRMTPPFATIAAAAGSPGYASTIMRRSFGSGSEYDTPATPPSASGSDSGQHRHVHYTPFAAGATGEAGTQNGNTVTPSPSPPASASISVPSTSASGPLGLSTSSASTSSALSAAGASTLTSTSTLPQIGSTQDNNFIYYHPPSQQHDRIIPPLSVHPHSYSHSQLHSPQGSQSHSPHFPPAGSINSTGHYVHTYTARPSPLSQANNIVTGPAAGPLTPLSVPHSATEGADGTGSSNGTQLPPLAYMDRLVGSNSSNGPNHNNHASSLGEAGVVKVEFTDSQAQGNGGSGNAELGGGGTSVGREPLTPLSAESPIGPGVGGRHGRKSVLGGQ